MRTRRIFALSHATCTAPKHLHPLFRLILALGLGSPAVGQVDRAGLSGTVTDSSGRVLPQTHVIAVQNDTGLRRETTSSSSGTYDIPELPVGVYTITFDHPGFKTLPSRMLSR